MEWVVNLTELRTMAELMQLTGIMPISLLAPVEAFELFLHEEVREVVKQP